MIDNAAIYMQSGKPIALERISSVDDNTMTSHYHDYYELFFLESGSRSIIIGNKTYDLKPHDFVVIPPYTMHHSCSAPGVNFSRTVIYFKKEEIPEELIRNFSEHVVPCCFKDVKAKHVFLEKVNSMFEEQDLYMAKSGRTDIRSNDNDPAFMSMTVLNSELKLLLIHALRHTTKTERLQNEPKIASIVSFIHNNYYEDLCLDDVAEKFFISKYYLCREFKKFTLCSFIEYLNKIRILHAQRLFVESNKKITEIAYEVGFSSLTHFERIFSQNTNQTPKKMCLKMRKVRDDALHIEKSDLSAEA